MRLRIGLSTTRHRGRKGEGGKDRGFREDFRLLIVGKQMARVEGRQ